jgi:16S rRNA (uracil1498-N3)-methyltransferase
MRSIRAFIGQPLADKTEMVLPEGPAHHLLRVLRLRPGDSVRLFDGSGFEFPAEILPSQRRHECRVRLGTPTQPVVESYLDITLFQAIGRGDRMDWCVQKATELGVTRIAPIVTARTEVRLDAGRADKRCQHWQQVANAAAEQSGRVRVPTVASPQALETITPGDGLSLFLDPLAERGAADLHRPACDHYVLVVGPEGGFSSAETAHLQRHGFSALRLGPRIMRTETAGPVTIALLQARFGDLA